MSEFKFACPVCGQHITASTDAAGTQIECPTCFQKLVVPQGPAAGADTKLILSAAKVGDARPIRTPQAGGAAHIFRPSYIPIFIPVLVLLALGALGYIYRDRLFRVRPQPATATATSHATSAPAPPPPLVFHPVPTNIHWSLDLADAIIPESTAAGSIRRQGFLCERAILNGGTLTLRQGNGSAPDLGVRIQLFAKTGEELAGKTIEITPEREPPQPKATLLWKDDSGKPRSKGFESGYTVRLIFAQPAAAKMAGKIYLAFPDKDSSVVAGTFLAEIKKPSPPKPKKPKPPPSTTPSAPK